jgi:hypothetical protein
MRVRANPSWIRYRDSETYTTEFMNEWDLDVDPTNPKFLLYSVDLYGPPGWVGGMNYRVVVSLNINDSMHRHFKTMEEALKAFEAIQPYTTIKTFKKRGYRTW